jgi:Multicopper oxidase
MPITASRRAFHLGYQSRREFLQSAGTAGLALVVAGTPALAMPAMKPDYTLRIAPASVEIAPGKIIQTTGYNGTVPGPLIRLREGKRVTINVINDSDVPDLVHWHGLKIPSQVDRAQLSMWTGPCWRSRRLLNSRSGSERTPARKNEDCGAGKPERLAATVQLARSVALFSS